MHAPPLDLGFLSDHNEISSSDHFKQTLLGSPSSEPSKPQQLMLHVFL